MTKRRDETTGSEEPPDLDEVDLEFLRTYRRVERRVSQEPKPLARSVPRLDDIADELGISRPGAKYQVDRLVELGLVDKSVYVQIAIRGGTTRLGLEALKRYRRKR